MAEPKKTTETNPLTPDQKEPLTMEIALKNLTETAIVKYDEIMPPPKEGVAKKTFEQQAAAIKDIVDKFQIKGIEDIDNYNNGKQMLQRLVKYRTGIDDTRKELKSPALQFGKNIDAEAKRRTALLAPSELAMKAKVEAIDKLLQVEKDKKTEERKKKLLEVGFTLEGTFYLSGKEIVPVSNVAALTDEQFNATVERGQAEAERLIEELAKQKELEAELELLRGQGATSNALDIPPLTETAAHGGVKRDLKWFMERIGKEVRAFSEARYNGVMLIKDNAHAVYLANFAQSNQSYYFEDLTAENAPNETTISNGPAPIGPGSGRGATPPATTPSTVGNPGTGVEQSIKIRGFQEGYEEAISDVMKVLNDPEKMLRSTIIERVAKLKPHNGQIKY